MKDVCAFVVGVARYGPPWNADSAAQNAYVITRLLLLGGVPPDRINAFIDPEGLSERQRQVLGRRGITLRSTTATEIAGFWRTELPTLLTPGDKLFTYWSGHGATDAKQNRIFFCRDYSNAFNSQLFNATQFLAHLRSSQYAQSTQQFFFADVCGTYSGNPMDVTDGRPDDATMREVDQLSVYASADGAYANANHYGAFTELLIDVLANFRTQWPSSDAFLAALQQKIALGSQRPFWIRWAGKHQHVPYDQLVGRPSGYVTAITKLLAPFALAGDVLKRPYRQTIRNRRVAPLLPSYELPRLVDALSAVPDEWDAGAPFALIQFMVRLSREANLQPTCREAIERWIAQNSAVQVRAEIDQLLANEIRRVMLLIDIANDRHGRPTTAEAQLLEMDGWPVAGFTRTTHEVQSDEALLKWMVDQLQSVLDLDEKARPEVHVLVDPPLFHLPFHKAPLDPFALGHQFDCILHFRRRARGDIRTQPERWQAWAQSLRGTALDQLALVRIDLHPTPIPAGAGICFAHFAHGPHARAPTQVQRLYEWLVRGAPYLCWPLDDAGVAGADLSAALRRMVDTANDFDAIPERIRDRRMEGCAIANELAVLWDDPEWRLPPPMVGVGQ